MNKGMGMLLRKIWNRFRYRGGGDGAYRFLVRNWNGLDDINLLAACLSTETYRAWTSPQSLPLTDKRSILVVAPHQDDELVGAGGLMLMARDAGLKLTVAFMTDGAQSSINLDGKILSPSEVVEVREREAKAVCQAAGARYECLSMDNITMRAGLEHVDSLATIVGETQPDVILAPWLFDGSPKHRVSCQLLRHALAGPHSANLEVWGYQVNNTPFTNGFVEITDHIEEKDKLFSIYASQNYGIRRYDHMTRGLGAWNSRFLPSKSSRTEPRYAEIFLRYPQRNSMA